MIYTTSNGRMCGSSQRFGRFCLSLSCVIYVLFAQQSTQYAYCDDGSDEFDRDETTLTLIKPSTISSEDGGSVPEARPIQGKNKISSELIITNSSLRHSIGYRNICVVSDYQLLGWHSISYTILIPTTLHSHSHPRIQFNSPQFMCFCKSMRHKQKCIWGCHWSKNCDALNNNVAATFA